MGQSKRRIEDLDARQLKELEGDWRAGLLPVKVIAAKYRIDPAELRAFARQEGWDKGDLGSAIKNAATSALVQRAVGETVPDGGLAPDARETVQKYGQIVASVIESQRADIGRARARVQKYVQELEELDGPDIDEAAIEGLIKVIEDQDPQLAKLLRRPNKSLLPVAQRLTILDAKAEVLKKLAIATEKLVALEREAWGMDDKKGDGGLTYDDFLAELYGETQPKQLK